MNDILEILAKGGNAVSTITGAPVPTFTDEIAARQLLLSKMLAPVKAGFRNLTDTGGDYAWYDREKGDVGIYAEPKILESIMAGPRAKIADLAKLAKAKSLIAAGTDKEIVRKATGWFMGKDGKWRFEIDDSGAFFDPELVRAGKNTYLKYVLDHPLLNKAYPELMKKLRFLRSGKYKKGEALYDDILKRIETSKKPTLEDVMHEIQHAIQRYEGFSTGSSPEYMAMRGMDNPAWAYKNLDAEIEAEEVANRLWMTAEERLATAPKTGGYTFQQLVDMALESLASGK